jgi:hypothetical protein
MLRLYGSFTVVVRHHHLLASLVRIHFEDIGRKEEVVLLLMVGLRRSEVQL